MSPHIVLDSMQSLIDPNHFRLLWTTHGYISWPSDNWAPFRVKFEDPPGQDVIFY
jgi:hypothetical protein